MPIRPLSLSQKIDALRAESRVPREYKLKFNPAPDGFDHDRFVALKQSMIELAINHDCRLLVNVIPA